MLRDESSEEEAQVPITKPVACDPQDVEAEIPISQKRAARSSKSLKRLRKLSSDPETPAVKIQKIQPKQKARRGAVESEHSSSDKEVEAAKEGDQESLISEDCLNADIPSAAVPEDVQDHGSPSAPNPDSEIDINNLPEYEVLNLEAPPAHISTPPTTPLCDSSFNADIPVTPVLNADFDNQNLEIDQEMDVDCFHQVTEDQTLTAPDGDESVATHTVVISEHEVGEEVSSHFVPTCEPVTTTHANSEVFNTDNEKTVDENENAAVEDVEDVAVGEGEDFEDLEAKETEGPAVEEEAEVNADENTTPDVALKSQVVAATSPEAGPSGHAPTQAVSKAALIKKFMVADDKTPWSETPRGKEWSKSDFIPSSSVLADHYKKADEFLLTDEFKAQLRISALSTRHLSGEHYAIQAQIGRIKDAITEQNMNWTLDKKKFFQPTHDRIAYIEKEQEKQKAQLDQVLKNQDSQQAQLNEIQNSMEILVSLLLPEDDAKKGEKVSKSKCKSAKPLKKDDHNDAEDQGNSEKSRGPDNTKGKQIRTSAHAPTNPDSYRRKRSSDTPKMTDEEFSKKLSMEENPDVDIEALKAEEEILKSEHEKAKFQKISKNAQKPPRPIEKGIVINERVNAEASRPNTRSRAKAGKGKEKIDEPVKPQKMLIPPQVQMKHVCKLVQVLDDTVPEDKTVQVLIPRTTKKSQSTSDSAHVDRNQDLLKSEDKDQTTSDIPHVGLGHTEEKKPETTSDKAQVVVTSGLAEHFAKHFRKPTQLTEVQKPIENLLQSRTILGKQGRNMAGLGSHKEIRINDCPVDHSSLSKPGVGVTPESLDKLESVQLVYHSGLKEQIFLHFMTDGRVYQVKKADLQLKNYQEPQHVLFMLQVRDKYTHAAAQYL